MMFVFLLDEGVRELDPQKNAAIWIRANDLVVNQAVAAGKNMSTFDAETWNVADWRRVG